MKTLFVRRGAMMPQSATRSIGYSAAARNFALRIIGGCVLDFAGWFRLLFDSGPVAQSGIDVMCQTLHFALQEKQQSFSQDDASLSLGCQPSQIAQSTGRQTLGVDLDLEEFGQARPSGRR